MRGGNGQGAGQKSCPKMGKPCECQKKCIQKIPDERRQAVHSAYWTMTYTEKRNFIFGMVKQKPVKRVGPDGPTRRTKSLSYSLTTEQGVSTEVCKTFFLATLGYHPKNDRIIQSVVGNCAPSSLAPPVDRRGKHVPVNKIDLTPIYEHIESFNPTISHYRREHAPNRRYLPTDINVQMMFNDF